MKSREKEQLKKKIEEDIKNVIRKINEYSEICKPIPPANAIGRVSRMDAINNKSVVESALLEAKKRLQKLNYSLKNLAKQDFGYCLKCKKTISFNRLIIRPESTCCIKCAQ